ncbi:hypothetical protein VTK26DRAFT_4265 [Humicola hyalothermophila]
MRRCARSCHAAGGICLPASRDGMKWKKAILTSVSRPAPPVHSTKEIDGRLQCSEDGRGCVASLIRPSPPVAQSSVGVCMLRR